MSVKIDHYKMGIPPKRKTNRLWPLYGAGIENLGIDNKPIEVPIPVYGSDELLVRHDACGLCFSDVKVIRLGMDHPRIYRDIKKEPVVLGHEVVMTVVGIGENLTDQYKLGDRFIIQAAIFINGISYAYGYEIQGGLSQYNVIDQRVLNGDHGNYLIPVNTLTGYAESATVEPWACVIAAYNLEYRTKLKPDGATWIIGPDNQASYQISHGLDEQEHPSKILLTNLQGAFGSWVRGKAEKLGIEIVEVVNLADIKDKLDPKAKVDDIILLRPTAELIEQVSPHLAFHGIMALVSNKSLERKVKIDVGRIHYNRWVYIGGSETDIARLYSHMPVRSSLKPGGRVLFVGAGGPMGRMHVQHAIEAKDGPSTIICTDVSKLRLNDLYLSHAEEVKKKGIELICLNPKHEDYMNRMEIFKEQGFDDVIVFAPITSVISDSATYLAREGVMNIFAGVARGTFAELDLNDTIFKDVRFIGHSGSAIDDMRLMLNKVETGQLNTNHSVAAIGSLGAVKDGMRALIDATFPGKVVIFPHIKNLPLTALPDLKEVLPEVFSKLKNGRQWTNEAEEALLDLMLEDED
ncbi:MAG TPA: alcohol dehydrogenase catalytic domain-containing protein [Anaerolineae bacterium]|nr:alcohol dehydrogenase catalytic domain-containing protein [Anaerolineae bacterium]